MLVDGRMNPVSVLETVKWDDTDMAGVVFYGNYVKYFELGEEAIFRQAGTTRQALMTQCGVWLPRTHVSCRFVRPARYGDTLCISSLVRELTDRRISIAHVLTDHLAGHLVATGEVRIACVTADEFLPISIPTAI